MIGERRQELGKVVKSSRESWSGVGRQWLGGEVGGDFTSLSPHLEVLVQKEAWRGDEEGRRYSFERSSGSF